MIEFLRRLFAPERSSETAKERLKLVLLSDHLSLAPEVVAALKADLLEVISRYVEIDPAHADVTFEQRDREVAMLASIPITGLRDRPIEPRLDTPSALAVEPAIASAAAGGEEKALAGAELPVTSEPEAPVPEPVAVPLVAPALRREASTESSAPTAAATSPVVRRRKRRRKATASVPRIAPAPTHATPGFDPA